MAAAVAAVTAVSVKPLWVPTRALNAIISASALADTHTPTLNRPFMAALPRLRDVP